MESNIIEINGMEINTDRRKTDGTIKYKKDGIYWINEWRGVETRFNADGKTCSVCGEFKSHDNYDRIKNSFLGTRSLCKRCKLDEKIELKRKKRVMVEFDGHSVNTEKFEFDGVYWTKKWGDCVCVFNKVGKFCTDCGEFHKFSEFRQQHTCFLDRLPWCISCGVERDTRYSGFAPFMRVG